MKNDEDFDGVSHDNKKKSNLNGSHVSRIDELSIDDDFHTPNCGNEKFNDIPVARNNDTVEDCRDSKNAKKKRKFETTTFYAMRNDVNLSSPNDNDTNKIDSIIFQTPVKKNNFIHFPKDSNDGFVHRSCNSSHTKVLPKVLNFDSDTYSSGKELYVKNKKSRDVLSLRGLNFSTGGELSSKSCNLFYNKVPPRVRNFDSKCSIYTSTPAKNTVTEFEKFQNNINYSPVQPRATQSDMILYQSKSRSMFRDTSKLSDFKPRTTNDFSTPPLAGYPENLPDSIKLNSNTSSGSEVNLVSNPEEIKVFFDISRKL